MPNKPRSTSLSSWLDLESLAYAVDRSGDGWDITYYSRIPEHELVSRDFHVTFT